MITNPDHNTLGAQKTHRTHIYIIICIYIYNADYATMVTDSRAYPERNGPPDPKTPENGSALLRSTTSFSMAAAPTIPSPLGIQKPPAIRPPWATCLIGCDNPMVIRSIRQLIVIKNVSKHIHKSDRFSWGKHTPKKFSLFFKQEFLEIWGFARGVVMVYLMVIFLKVSGFTKGWVISRSL